MERARKRKSASDESPAKDPGTRRSPRQTPESQPRKKPRVDSVGKSKLSPASSRDRSEIYSSTRSGSFTTTSNSNNITVDDNQQTSSSISTNSASGECQTNTNTATINSYYISSCSKSNAKNNANGSDGYAKPGCSYKTSTTSNANTPVRRQSTSSSNTNNTSYSGTTSSSNSTTSGSSSNNSTTNGSTPTATSGASSRDMKSPATSRDSSSRKRELKNLQDAWTVSVSPFRTRSQSEEGANGRQTPRRQIHFTLDDSSSTCYPPSSPSTTKSLSSELLSSTDSETIEAAKNLGKLVSHGVREAYAEDAVLTSQVLNREQFEEEIFSPISSMSSKISKTCNGNSPKRKRTGSMASSSSLLSDLCVSSDTQSSNAAPAEFPISVNTGKGPFVGLSCVSDVTDPSMPHSEEKTLLEQSGDRPFIPLQRKSVSTDIHKNNHPIESKRQLRSRSASAGLVQATTSKAASCDGLSAQVNFAASKNTLENCTSDSASRKLRIIETTNSTSRDIYPHRHTRSRPEPGTDNSKSDEDAIVPKTPKLSEFMTIVTSEHDYFRRDTSQLTADSDTPLSIEHKPDTGRNKTFTIYTVESSESSGVQCPVPESSSTEDKLSMARSDNALSCMPSDREETFHGSPHLSSLANDSNAAVSDFVGSNVLSSEYRNGASPASICDEGKNLGFDLSDYVIRRRRLRSESTKDELWEGFPAITPFRKQVSKLKSDGRVEPDVVEASLQEGEIYKSDLKSSPNNSPKQSSSSTTDLISEIDSILSDTQSSCQRLATSDTENITQFHEETQDDYRKTYTDTEHLGSLDVQELIDNDINSNTRESFVNQNAAKFSSESVSHTSLYTSPSCENLNNVKCENILSVNDAKCNMTFNIQADDTPSDASTTPIASRPESVWWSEKSDDWLTPDENPLKISPDVKLSSDENTSQLINTVDGKQKKCDSDTQDGSLFMDITLRKENQDNLSKEEQEDDTCLLLRTENPKTFTVIDKHLSTASSSANRNPSASDESDGEQHLGRFRVKSSRKRSIDTRGSQEEDSDAAKSLASPVRSKSESTSSSEFLLWSKKKDHRKLSFPKIVLRKCKETVRYSASNKSKEVSARDLTPKKDRTSKALEERIGSGCRKTKNSFSSSDDSSTPKRSARLMKRVDVALSGQPSRSTDFVYTSLKREDSKTKSSSQISSQGTNNSSGSKSKAGRDRRHSGVHPGESSTTARDGSQVKLDRETDSSSNNKTSQSKIRKVVLKKTKDISSDKRSSPDKPQSRTVHSIFRRRKGPLIDEELLTNPVIDKHACVLWSSEHRRHFQLTHPDATSAELDEILRHQWSHEVTDQEKMKYFTRARDAVTDEDKHAQRTRRDTRRSGRTGGEKKLMENDRISSLERFTRLKIKRQKDLLTKWLHFFQKILSRREYAEFIEDVKQGILEAEARDKPNKSRGLTSKIFSHKKLLFLKMNDLKDHVMKQYCYRQQRQKELHRLAFDILVRRLIEGKPCAFIKGCRSRVLTTILQDLKEMEYGDSVAVLGYPISSSSFASLYKEIVETVESCMFRDDVTESNNNGPEDASKDSCASSSKSETTESDSEATDKNTCNTQSTLGSQEQTAPGDKKGSPPSGISSLRTNDFEWYDKPVNVEAMGNLLDGLSKLPHLPVLQHNTLDSMFLPPPARIPASTTSVPVTVRPVQLYPRSSIPGWMTSGQPFQNRYNNNGIPRMWGQGQAVRNAQIIPVQSCSTRMPVSNKPIDLSVRLPRPEIPARGIPRMPNTPNAVNCTPWMAGHYPPAVRDVMYSEARDAFNRSYTSTSDSCCDMDSPACVLSTLVMADKTKNQN